MTPQDIETPNDTVPYSRLGLEAIACKVAADLIERIPARMWESCRLDPKAAAAQCRRECDEIVRDERLRRFAHDALGKVQRHVP